MKKVLICGDREWDNQTLMEHIISKIPLDKYDTIIHGNFKGADRMAGKIGLEKGFCIVPYPAEWKTMGFNVDSVVNRTMIDEGKPDLVLAFHNNIINSKGTINLINIASKEGTKVILINESDDYSKLEIT